MAKKNKKKKVINADSIDVDSTKIEDEKVESKKEKNIEEVHIESIVSKTPFYLKHRIPIFTSFYKIRNNYYSTNKKKFFIYTSLIIFSLLISVTLITIGGLWIGGVFDKNLISSDLDFMPGIIMAIGASILVVV
ncbi:MAG: hypothetical protein ACRCUM_01410 [Mycoplasmoidaceae bacterium]